MIQGILYVINGTEIISTAIHRINGDLLNDFIQ